MKAHILATTALAAMLAGCATTNAVATTESEATAPAAAIPQGTGYFAADSTLPFLAPDFTRISEADYEPAFEQSMAIQQAKLEAIVNRPAAPTLTTTILELEKTGRTQE